MNTSLFELFKIGIGPSSSHTVGPMRAALRFVRSLSPGQLEKTASVAIDLYGSLALTGIGHATDRAVLLGLMGEAPDTVEPEQIEGLVAKVRSLQQLNLGGSHAVAFRLPEHLRFHREQMYPVPEIETHPNGLRFTVRDAGGTVLAEEVFYSIGGGFILSAGEFAIGENGPKRKVPYPFSSAAELLDLAARHELSVAELVLVNEIALIGAPGIIRPAPLDSLAARDGRDDVEQRILTIWQTMSQCIDRGMRTEGILPGGLKVRRRAPSLARQLRQLGAGGKPDPLAAMDSATLVAIAVNEENAAGGRVVTAPTNGAAGIIPAVAHHYLHYASDGLDQTQKQSGLLRYFLTAAAIGILYKENASISGAEVGCQGEVGVACSMAAGGLVAALGGPNLAVEHAAEIAMEHNLGMTCDPIAGLVQIPCIERNGMGAVKAINAARLAMNDPGSHKLSLDQVIDTMYRTGLDMQSRYKETSLAGLALNVIEC
jgi:L-serine dehydratase